MAKDQTKVLKFVLSKLEVGVSTDGTEPGSYTDIGFNGEVPMKVEMKSHTYPTGDGSEYQKGYECSVETEALEIINITTIESLVKNANIWIKATPVGTVSASNPIVRAKNFIGNLEASLDLAVKGKSAYKVVGKKYVAAFADFVTTAAS